MADLAADYQLLRKGAGAIWLARDVVSVSGPAAVSFLQGQCSQDVASLPAGGSAWSWVLQPQGKVEVLCRVTRVADDHMVLDTDGGWGEPLAARLNRFKLRTKADIASVAWRCLALRGPGTDAVAAADGNSLVVDAGWPGLPGVDLLGTNPALPVGVGLVGEAAYEVARIEAGVPRMGAELTEKTIPAETGLVERTVSFTKGCYTGQELVARIDSRGGHVPRRLRLMTLDRLAPIGAAVRVAAGAAVGASASAGEKTVGTVTSVAAHPLGGAVALAYLSRDVTPPAPVTVTWDEGRADGQAESLPLAP